LFSCCEQEFEQRTVYSSYARAFLCSDTDTLAVIKLNQLFGVVKAIYVEFYLVCSKY